MGDCLLVTDQLETGAKGFWKILERQQKDSNFLSALPILANIYRHVGALPNFIEVFESFRSQHIQPDSPVFHFVSGLTHFYSRRSTLAVSSLLLARVEPSLRDKAVMYLIDIYTHDDSLLLYSSFFHKDKFKPVNKKYLGDVESLIG